MSLHTAFVARQGVWWKPVVLLEGGGKLHAPHLVARRQPRLQPLPGNVNLQIVPGYDYGLRITLSKMLSMIWKIG